MTEQQVAHTLLLIALWGMAAPRVGFALLLIMVGAYLTLGWLPLESLQK
jgi:ABC-type dipeptide/oligopeptide/nickel transport system permease component